MPQDQNNKPRKKALLITMMLGGGCLAIVVCVSIVFLGFSSLTPVGENFDPAWSPDGTRIAFNSTRDGGDDIYIMQSDGRNVVRLTTRSAFFGFFKYSTDPVWSPDGKQLAFVSNRSDHVEIYIMNSDGSQVRQLTDSPAEGGESSGDFGEFDWSPDGQRIVFTLQKGKLSYDINVPEPLKEIYVVNVDGTHMTRLTNLVGYIRLPKWSPDGGRIAFSFAEKQADNTALYSATYHIYVMNIDGTNLTRLTDMEGRVGDLRWSPDGSRIAFAFRKEQTDIYVMEPDGTNLVQLTNDGAGSIDWSPDGNRIAFNSGGLIYVMNADGTHTKKLTNSPTFTGGEPRWSPDGQRIAFDWQWPATNVNDIFIMNDDGSNRIQLTGK